MRLVTLFTAVLLCPSFAATEWSKIASPNFEMYTTAGEKDARRALEYFEQVRDFFMRIKSQQVTTRLPVTIVAFKNEKQYKAYSPRETTAAYFIGDEQRDYIVMGGVGSEHYPTAVHEYMHLLVRHSGLKLPVWLNEGLAEVHSTLRPLAGQMLLGAIPQGRTYALQQLKWFPTIALVSINHDSPEFNEKDRSGLFYSQSWMLTHMLMLHDAYSRQFGKFVGDLSSSGSSEGAFQRVYGKTPADIDRDMQAYYRSNSLKGVLFDVKLRKMEVSPGQPASELETDLTLAKLTALLKRKDEAARRYAEIAKANPDNWQVQEAIGHLYWQTGDLEKAKEGLRKAVTLKSTSWKTYWDYARLAQNEPDVVETLRTALRMNPELAEGRLMLGYALYNGRNYKEAYDALSEIRQITPDRAASFFLMKAFSAMELGKKAEAKSSAEMAKKYTKSAVEISQANNLIEFIDRPAVSSAEHVLAPQVGTPSARLEASDAEDQVSVLRGVLQEIECLGKEARLRILSGNTSIALLIRDPKRVTLKNSDSSSVDFVCGPQKNARIIVEFKPNDDTQFKTLGDIVTLEFTTRPKGSQ
jgi:tetratricopeptide (TPR) repeat protein